MTDILTPIAAELASVLRLTPCTCNEAGSWPTFKAAACVSEKSKHQLKQCRRCQVLAKYDAYASIVQIPVPPRVKP